MPGSDKVGNIAGLVPGSMWTFLLGSTAGYKGEYHKDFNENNYLKWWTNQLTQFFTYTMPQVYKKVIEIKIE